MRKDKSVAIRLRQEGLSYNKISKELGIPKSTLASWFSQNDWSIKIRDQLLKQSHIVSRDHIKRMNAIRLQKWEEWRQKARDDGEKSFRMKKNDPLFISGIMLYWGEGDGKVENSVVRLANTDSRMIKLFVLFLEKKCFVDKVRIKAFLVLYKDLKDQVCRKYWSQEIGISESNFVKSQYIRGRHPSRRLKNGICTVYICSRQLKEKIIVWINLLSKDLINAGVV